jgi:drug/metabolite transporter (DMT)-like permease
MNGGPDSFWCYIRTRAAPILEAILVAAIWGSSFVGVKVALEHTGPFTIAALRYSMAAMLLLPWILFGPRRCGRLSRGVWIRLTVIGIAQYALGNGALFLALRTVSSTAASLAISLVPIPIVLLEVAYLRERPSRVHLLGILITIGGSVLFFSTGLTGITKPAIGLLALATISFAVLPVLGRDLARARTVSNTTLTAVPLAIGGAVLLIIASACEGLPHMALTAWGIVVGLALVNTLAGYLLFNHALHRLHAGEANILLNLTPVATALIAWGALGDRLTAFQMGGIAVVIAGASLAQLRGKEAEEARP